MIAREVPPRPSRRAIVVLIALVAATGAVLCENFVAGERERTVEFLRAGDPYVSGDYAIDPYNAGITRHRDIAIGDGKSAPATYSMDVGSWTAYGMPPSGYLAYFWRVGADVLTTLIEVHGGMIDIGPFTLGFDVSLVAQRRHFAALACFDAAHRAPDDCLYFDEAHKP